MSDEAERQEPKLPAVMILVEPDYQSDRLVTLHMTVRGGGYKSFKSSRKVHLQELYERSYFDMIMDDMVEALRNIVFKDE